MLVLTEVSSIARQAICKANLPRGDEGQSFQMVGHEGLALRDPDTPQVGDILALLFKRLKVFFCVTAQADAAAARPKSNALSVHGLRPAQTSIRLSSDPAPHPLLDVRQLSVSRIALRFWLKRPGLTFEPHHLIDELDRYAQAHGRLRMRVSLFDKPDGAFSQFNRMRLTHL
jgi:hypothetical protein